MSELGDTQDRDLCLAALRWTPGHLTDVFSPITDFLQQDSFPLQ